LVYRKKAKIFLKKISHNGFGISEVAGGIPPSGGRPEGHFAYSELGDVASGASGEPDEEEFRSR
jgi:hypothetical protein